MVTAKQVINSIKPNLTRAPPGPTKKGSAGYDNIRDDIEKTKSLREGSIEKVPVNDNDIVNKKYVSDYGPYVIVANDGSGDFNCDGTADDVEIQAAIDQVGAAGGGTVYIKGSNTSYKISSTITILWDGVVILGDGISTELTGANKNTTIFQVGDGGTTYHAHNEITNLSLNQSGAGTGTGDLIHVYYAKFCKFNKITALEAGRYGLHLNRHARFNMIDQAQISGYQGGVFIGNDNYPTRDQSSHNFISDTQITGTNAEAIIIESSNNNENRFSNCAISSESNNLIITLGDNTTIVNGKTTFMGCHIYNGAITTDNSYPAINMLNNDFTIISGCTIEGTDITHRFDEAITQDVNCSDNSSIGNTYNFIVTGEDETDFDLTRNGVYSQPKIKLTTLGGFAIKLTNKTGANSVAGQCVRADTATNDATILTAANEEECIGVFLESGIADAAEAWVVISGIADVAMEDNTAATRGNWVRTSTSEAGYADATNASPPSPASFTHFDEIGHCIESVAATGGGTHILARCVLHFN